VNGAVLIRHRKILLRAASVVMIVEGVIIALWVGLIRGLVPAPAYVDCMPPSDYTGGG